MTQNASLREKCPYSELFWSVFSRTRTKYYIRTPYISISVQMPENMDQNSSEYTDTFYAVLDIGFVWKA